MLRISKIDSVAI
jgi:vesicle-fusing ATPase